MFLTWRRERTVGARFVFLMRVLVVICDVGFSRLYLSVHGLGDELKWADEIFRCLRAFIVFAFCVCSR